MEIPKISVCICTKNSQGTLESCLRSVKGLADEIVVLDCNSKDRTCNICQRYGARIYQHNFIGFADLKSTVIAKANNDWVLILDADEEVSPELQKEILESLRRSREAAAYYIPIKNYLFGKKMHISPPLKPQLARKEALTFARKYIHERLQVREEFAQKTRRLRNPILHHTYEDVSDYLTKFRQYTSLEALKIVDEGKNPSFLKTVLRGLAYVAYLLFWKRGLLDGYRGLFFASMAFQYHLVVHAKVQDLRRLIKENLKGWRDIWIDRECQR